MTDDPATDESAHRGARPVAVRSADLRRRRVMAAGYRGDRAAVRRGLADRDPRVQEAALGALARLGALSAADVVTALTDGPVRVRRRAVDAALSVRGRGTRVALLPALVRALGDPDPLVVVGAAWTLAERRHRPAVVVLTETARAHGDARCREAAVAALGAIGDPAGLPGVLAGLEDKPTVRRRATVALAGFDHARVEPALRRAAEDRDWQVRQAAEELLGPALSRPG